MSRHHTAETNPAYRRAFAVEPAPFCRGCHAPEASLALDPADPTRPPARDVAELGVGCVTCHVVEEGAVLAAPRHAPPRSDPTHIDPTHIDPTHIEPAPAEATHVDPRLPHDVVRSADFAHVGACASCHEFTFPGRGGDHDGAFMQTTVREHAASAASARACASCHMPETEGRRSHTFAATRDAAWLRESIHVSAAVDAVGAAVVTLRARAGHAVPTGDLFRRLEIGAERVDGAGRVDARDVRWLARHFEIRIGERGRTLVRDDRLRDAPVDITLDVACSAPTASSPSTSSATSARPADDGAHVRWWVTYQRVAESHRGDEPADADVESAVVLHEGRLCVTERSAGAASSATPRAR